MYFNTFPKVFYSSTGKSDDEKLVTHILKRVAIKDSIEDDMLLMDRHTVRENETPEVVSHKHFGSAQYHWVILLTNNIIDRYYDWPLTTPQFNQFLVDKYGDNIDGVHHYEITQTSGPTTSLDNSHLIQVNAGTAGAVTITNREYEQSEQDRKRRIKLLDPSFIDQFVQEFELLMSESPL